MMQEVEEAIASPNASGNVSIPSIVIHYNWQFDPFRYKTWHWREENNEWKGVEVWGKI